MSFEFLPVFQPLLLFNSDNFVTIDVSVLPAELLFWSKHLHENLVEFLNFTMHSKGMLNYLHSEINV